MQAVRNKKGRWFKAGILMGMSLSMALASVPKSGISGRVTDDTAIYQRMGETQVRKVKKPEFDADLAQLSSIEGRYREKLPSYADSRNRMSGPMKRISAQKYRHSSAKRTEISRN